MSDRFRDVLRVLLEMSDAEVLELYRQLGERMGAGPLRSEIYVSTMSEILGEDIRRRSRRHGLVWGRFIVMHELLGQGWSTPLVGDVFGMDHSTVVHARQQVDNMLEWPGVYPGEYAIYMEFKRRINDGRMRMECQPGGPAV